MADITFPQLIQRACGIDIHLKVVVATIDGVGIQRETRSFLTFTSSLTELKEWLLSNEITHVAMESTGVYWKPVHKVLEVSIPNVWVVNARHIKHGIHSVNSILCVFLSDFIFTPKKQCIDKNPYRVH